jgi:predicted alpha/beta-hydrolase family hydrolase
MTLAADFQGPTHGADRAVLLAPGAGADRHAGALVAVADALEARGIPSLRFDFPYRIAGRKAPDRPPVLDAATREASIALCERTGLAPTALVLGGRSMGGRIASMAVASADDPLPALGLLLLGYPLHPAGKPERIRDDHFPGIRCPVLFVSGTRDSLAPEPALTRSAKQVGGPVRFHWLDTADHGFRPLKRSGCTIADVLADVAETSVTWVEGLGG